MTMTDHDLDWLAAQAPRQMDIDHGARERALRALNEHRSRSGRHGSRLGRLVRTRTFGCAVATGAAAVAAALVLSTTGGDGGGTSAADVSPSAGAPPAAVQPAGTETAPLVHLAAFVAAAPAPVGDATLVARKTNGVTVYDLYGDNGQYFFSRAKSGLAGEVSARHDRADGLFAREIAAAKLAATGDVQKAAQDLANAPDPSRVSRPEDAVRSAHEASLYANWVWGNAQDALIAGSGDPQIRAGVLRILATLPDVTVTNGTSGGQPTLVLTAGETELGIGYTEQLTINADTGVPIRFAGGATGEPSTTVHYKVSRVTLADPLAAPPSEAMSSQ
jgi:hypothetical protein